ncbi:serine hydrolase domain-containing protein [Archangium lipolyticum]|uniref:serine hydrolase domain-containing protein n=1 Tax=Archangium lipolyticum TaxID=2970465 RepID=UPI00214A14BE|nr:serine hydrolase domain-containing protein [Archangium lipolyticum]
MAASLMLACVPRSEHPVQSAVPVAAPGDWLERWLAAFNDARASTYPDFVKAHIPTLVPYLDDDLGLREATGGFTLLRREQTAPGQVTAWVRDRNWERFSKVVLSIGDGRIDDLSFLGAPPPDDFAIRRLGEHEALTQLRQKLRVEAAANRFSGAVLVAKDGVVLLREAYCSRDVEKGLAATPATRFCIGSMGKMFTAVAVLQLVQNGRLRLTDTVASLLPAHPDTALARQVTVQHLLTHTGGTGDFFGADYDAHAAELHTPSDFIRLFGTRQAAFPPGLRWGYSNFGFILLGAIVEQVSGLAWDVYLERNVFRTAGMSSTSPLASAGNTALPYTGAARTGLKPLPFYVGLPAGGGYSTIDDLHRFGTALREARLLDARHLAMLTTANVQAGNAQWSLGLRVAVRNGEAWYGHGGSAPGVNADFAIYPQSGYEVIVLANRGHPHAFNVADFIGTRLPRVNR